MVSPTFVEFRQSKNDCHNWIFAIWLCLYVIPLCSSFNTVSSTLSALKFNAALTTFGDENMCRIPKVGGPMPPRPDWLHVVAPGGSKTKFNELKVTVSTLGLRTVCEEAHCPNIGDCWNGGTGTIMLLGDKCTRGCRFCAVKTNSKPEPPDPMEPFKTALALTKFNVSYIVLTSVDRDDLVDGGAQHFATTVKLVKQARSDLLVECLVSDFAGNLSSVETLATCGLDVYAHNIETVERLQKYVRDKRASYGQSLKVLQYAKKVKPTLYTKSSIMLGLGETTSEVIQTLKDLRAHDVDVITFGRC